MKKPIHAVSGAPTILPCLACHIEGKEIVARFDGGRLSSDGDLLVLRDRAPAVGRRSSRSQQPEADDVGERMHGAAGITRISMQVARRHEDGNDATGLRSDPLFKMALGRVPSERDLC